MSFPSLIFWLIFVVPLVIFLVWLMRQNKDKKNGTWGLIIVVVIVAVAIIYMYAKTGGK
ncbi:hypothetical protein [Mucilaginibacter ginkgonis]|uniref:Uncharacterized protein n=1 Tax=Mucilaginibacter ginkgonis TaxID=2682091 RepID=A0A6I4IPG5_9SPHI|nr:hypothetical protein [Mucilaginibacter ginkgonis]QQL49220.1 hypothetical protein GO620_013690 [Mucilaginibacter ginkgonis]